MDRAPYPNSSQEKEHTMSPSSWRNRAGGILLFAIVFTSCMPVAYAGDQELISIRSLLAQAPSYHLRIVMLEGVARDVQVMPPTQQPFARGTKGACVLYGRATFSLDDGTTLLPVEVMGSCYPHAAELLPKEGDTVRLTASIHLLTTSLPVQVLAQATEIVMVDRH